MALVGSSRLGRWVVASAVVTLAGVAANACSLNPQPLPPDAPRDGGPVYTPPLGGGSGSGSGSQTMGGVDATTPALDSGAALGAEDASAAPPAPGADGGPDAGESGGGNGGEGGVDGAVGDAIGDSATESAADGACVLPACGSQPGYPVCPDPDGGGTVVEAASWADAKARFLMQCGNQGSGGAFVCNGYEYLVTSTLDTPAWTYYDTSGNPVANMVVVSDSCGCQSGTFPTAVGCTNGSPVHDPSCVAVTCAAADAATDGP